jgi:calcineurin-like phosphoesterase family protein
MLTIQLNKDQKIFFTSDTHYGHKNICRGVSNWTGGLDKTRDFKTLDQMNAAIVDGINQTVGQDDILVHLGDWSFGGFESIQEFRDRIICKNIYLILGNHDHHIENNRGNCQDLFKGVYQYTRLEVVRPVNSRIVEKFNFVLSHFPICSWHDMNKGIYHLFGHCHLSQDKKIMPGKSMDVGMDGNNLIPYELREVVSILKDRPNKTSVIPQDHHETEIR